MRSYSDKYINKHLEMSQMSCNVHYMKSFFRTHAFAQVSLSSAASRSLLGVQVGIKQGEKSHWTQRHRRGKK